MDKVRKDDIAIYLNAVPASFCDRLIREFHKGFALKEVITGKVSGADGDYRSDKLLTAKDIHFYDHERWDRLNCDLHTEYILPVIRDYLQDYKYIIGKTSSVDPKSCIMSLYEANRGHFCPHQDHLQGQDRSLTIICYLNTVVNGGATYFFNKEYRVHPHIGSVAVFPSNFVYGHIGEKPISGDKYITVSFCAVDVGSEESRDQAAGDRT